jgi:hypothetical protein
MGPARSAAPASGISVLLMLRKRFRRHVRFKLIEVKQRINIDFITHEYIPWLLLM